MIWKAIHLITVFTTVVSLALAYEHSLRQQDYVVVYDECISRPAASGH